MDKMESSSVKIRIANKNDINGLLSNRMDFIYSLKGIRAPKIFEDWTYDYLNAHLGDGTLVAWVAEVGERIVSACILCITQQIPTPKCRNGKIGYIYNVYTLEGYRKRGFATELIKRVKDYATEHEILELSLTATDDGYTLYEKQGFLCQEREMAWDVNACPVNHQ